MEIDLSWERGQGPLDFNASLDRFWSLLESDLERVVREGVLKIERRAKELVPVDTNTLRASIESVVEKVALDEIVGKAGTNVEYSEYVEMGTRHMQAQPYLRPAFEEVIPDLVDDVKNAVRKAERRAGST